MVNVSEISITFSRVSDRCKHLERPGIIPRKLYSHLLRSVIIYRINMFLISFIHYKNTFLIRVDDLSTLSNRMKVTTKGPLAD